MKWSSDWDSRIPMVARPKIAAPVTVVGLRPWRSETGAEASCPAPRPRRNSGTESWMRGTSTPNCATAIISSARGRFKVSASPRWIHTLVTLPPPIWSTARHSEPPRNSRVPIWRGSPVLASTVLTVQACSLVVLSGVKLIGSPCSAAMKTRMSSTLPSSPSIFASDLASNASILAPSSVTRITVQSDTPTATIATTRLRSDGRLLDFSPLPRVQGRPVAQPKVCRWRRPQPRSCR